MKVLVTGAAGFIGFFVAKRLLDRGEIVVGLDNFNDYYDVSLKEARASILTGYDGFNIARIDLADREAIEKLFNNERFDKVVHLGAPIVTQTFMAFRQPACGFSLYMGPTGVLIWPYLSSLRTFSKVGR